MKQPRCARAAVLAAAMLAASALCRATDLHHYGPHEYAIVKNGMAPNHRWSIAAHGDGEDGYDNFHLYLMAEPAHKRIGPLEEVNANLDTGPSAFTASWSPDSHHVTVSYRIARHAGEMVMYRIANRRAYPIEVPDVLTRALAGRKLPKELDTHSWWMETRWLAPGRFVCTLYCSYQYGTQAAQRVLGKYATTERWPPDNAHSKAIYNTEVAIDAICTVANDKCHIESLRPHPKS